jgi:hypothetical protein
MAHSKYTPSAIAFVERNPGCSKWNLAAYLTRSPRRCPSRQYYLVNTQIRLGNIKAVRLSNRYALFVNK